MAPSPGKTLMARSQPITDPEQEAGMYISRRLIATIAVLGALALGWLGNDLVSHMAATLSASPRPIELGSSEIAVHQDPLLAAGSAPVDASASQPPPSQPPPSSPTPPSTGGNTNVYLTIVNSPPGGVIAPVMAGGRSQGSVSGPNGQLRATSSTGSSSTPSRLVVAGGSAIVPNAPSSRSSAGSSHAPFEGIDLQLSSDTAAMAIGEHIVIAEDGAIVYVGDNGSLTANSGDAVAGGTVALDAQSSTFSSNYDPTLIVPKGTSAATASEPNGPSAATASEPIRTSASAPSSLSTTQPATGLTGSSLSAIPLDASPLVSAFIAYTGNRTADIAGYEDHSILTRGTGNVVTYDDSNVFMDRNGKINANTGDTDSAGLNAIATLRSTVSAGPHCDDGCDDESIIQAEAGVFDEGDVGVDGDGNVVWSPDIVAESPTVAVDCDDPAETNDDGCDDSSPEDNGDDDDSVDDESPDGDVSDLAEPAETRVEADSTRPAADNGEEPEGAPAAGSLIVGGDGIDDLSERVDGNFNVSTYDDSNVVIGGSGAVNAQIGDSDTGGTVTMDTVDSTVSGGNSR
jgi:hypothetical protein